jgi:hypothetical protein
MAKKKEKMVKTVEPEGEDHELYYHVEALQISRPQNCTFIINTGAPDPPPIDPPGSDD